MIPVTQPFLPPLEEYQTYISRIWQRNWLTNNGPLVNMLELQLKEYLGLNHLLFLGNGTIAIQLAIKALDLKGEIITTPFSYVATASSIVWEGCSPVFVDIDRGSLNIDPTKIEKAITKKTSAILATHVFGNPCEVIAIEAIAKKHKLKVIYDAAHCFGTKYKGKSVYEYGDISTTSFHATKLFHTTEGGAVFTTQPELLKKMAYMRNFGHNGPESFHGVGINAKNSEFHAAMGICNLKYIEEIKEARKTQCQRYDKLLKNLRIEKQIITPGSEFNYAYYPIILESEAVLLEMIKVLNMNEIYPRRYFYPSLSALPYVDKYSTPVSDDVAKRVLCLPLYHTLGEEDQEMVARLLLRVQNN
jgi:dTDP-4-amino-4,6-dideoxygalactose transaminase